MKTKPTVGAEVVCNIGNGDVLEGTITEVHSDTCVNVALKKTSVTLDEREAAPADDDWRNCDAHKFRMKADLGKKPVEEKAADPKDVPASARAE